MLSEWRKVSLEDIGTIIGGGTPSTKHADYYGGNISWITPKDLSTHTERYIAFGERMISEKGLKNSSARLLPRDTVLFSSRAPIGYVVIAKNELATNQGFKSVIPNKDICDPIFLYYLLIHKKHDIEGIASGTTFMEVSGTAMKNFKVLLPSLREQQRIAAILSALDSKIENNAAINRNLEEQAEAIFKSWFVDFEPFQDGEFIDSELGKIPKGWATGTFSSLIDSTISGDWGKETLTGNFTEQVYCIRGTDIPEVKKGNKGKMPFRFILPKNFLSKKLLVGDLVVEISGGSPTQSTGRSAVITQSLLNRYDKGMVCTNFCKALKPKPGYSMFVSHYWDYLYAMNKFFSYENGTTGIKNLDVNGFIDTEPIIIPPSSVVSAFSKLCNKCSELIYANGQENECLQRTRDTLLIKLMSREIDVSKVERMEALA